MAASVVVLIIMLTWGLILALLIAGMMKAASDQDRQIDESNSRYQAERMNEDKNNV